MSTAFFLPQTEPPSAKSCVNFGKLFDIPFGERLYYLSPYLFSRTRLAEKLGVNVNPASTGLVKLRQLLLPRWEGDGPTQTRRSELRRPDSHCDGFLMFPDAGYKNRLLSETGLCVASLAWDSRRPNGARDRVRIYYEA